MQGCGSHNCVIQKPEGVGHNDRCRCPEWKLHREIMKLRKQRDNLLAALQKVAEVEKIRWPDPPEEWIVDGEINDTT